jgi:sugar lactone lactonase YvrE
VSGDYRGQLCESPVWDADAECLWFVDVLSGVGRCRPADGDVKTWATPNWCEASQVAEECNRSLMTSIAGSVAWRCVRRAWLLRWQTRRTTAAANSAL